MTLIQKLRIFCKYHFTDHPHQGPVPEKMMKIARLGFNLDDHYLKLKSLGVGFTVKCIETVRYRDKDYPIYCIDFNAATPVRNRLFVLVGSHGNEEAGLYAIEKFMKHLEDNQERYKDLSIRIISPHNPVGVSYFSRYNGDGIDVNRDFNTQKTAETKAVATAFEKFNPIFAVALHEGLQPSGMFLYTNRYVLPSNVKAILKSLALGNVKLATKSYFGNTLKQPGWFPHTGFFLILVTIWSKLFKFQGFGLYCATKQIPALVIETSWEKPDTKQRVEVQYLTLKAVAALHADGSSAFMAY